MPPSVIHNTALSRYEVHVDEQMVGFAEYHVAGTAIVFPHTVIDPPMRGRGLAEVLVRHALDDARRRDLSVVAECWYVAQFIEANPDYEDLRPTS